MSEDDHSKFTAPRPDDEMHQGIPVPVTFSIDPEDRMPVPGPSHTDDRPPPLAVDTFVCMEDKRSFVIRNSDGSVWVSFLPADVSRLPNGEHYVEIRRLMQVVNERYPNRAVDYLDDAVTRDHFCSLGDRSTRLTRNIVQNGIPVSVVNVEPVRPACQHYIRMQTDISADRDRRYLSRSCAAQRSETGEYYSVGDAAIYACSLRSPRHPETESLMDEIDERDAKLALNKARAAAFDVDAELAKIADDQSSPGSLGVLGNKG